MDIRLEMRRVNGIWTLTKGSPELRPFRSERAAIDAGIEEAKQPHLRLMDRIRPPLILKVGI